MKSLKEEISNISQSIEFAREKLITEFEIWYEKKFGEPAIMTSESIRENQPAYEEPAEEDVDPDAAAYISARRTVNSLHKAKKGVLGKA